ncbi:hypothetical protein Pla52n_34100 [Stieleria varia]|uniref:Cupin domain protein n=2 Tax=Stieleria varia TaxID=2528005 RepID=A0A5C6ARN5_9BACT|nr:hypothetical protein Pla52n_34100 [Stieleria varia]
MDALTLRVVCCGDSPEKYTQIVDLTVDRAEIDQRVIDTVEQNLDAGLTRDLHNAAHHDQHGPVTYLQEVHEGGFFVTVGQPGQLQETFFGPGDWVAFTDDEGPGHGSRVGPDGVRRTMRILKGLLGQW